MGAAVRRTWPQSRITAAPVRDPNYSGPKVGIAGAIAVGLRAQSRLPGTEFLDAETKRQKSPLKCANAYRYLNPGSEWPENPRGNALFSVVPETCGLQRLDGGGSWAQTGDPPPSHRTGLRPAPGTEISNAETGRRKPAHHLAETESETRRERESPHFRAISARRLAKV